MLRNKEGARAGEWKTRVYISAEVLSDFFLEDTVENLPSGFFTEDASL